jgi:hypothetical protein
VIAYGDPAGSGVQGLRGESYFEAYGRLGIGISPSIKSPAIRATRISRRLERRLRTKDGETPALVFIKDRTAATRRSLTSYRYKENRSLTHEDPREEFHKEDDHGVDSLGYGIGNIPSPDDEMDPRGFPFPAARDFTTIDEWGGGDSDESVTLYGIPV